MSLRFFETADKAACCGCSACEAACPVSAIHMARDEEGFAYPVLDRKKCIECGRCQKVCPIENGNDPQPAVAAYAAVHRDAGLLKKSSSGGVFTALAEEVIRSGGIVFGAVMENNKVFHCKAETVEQLAPMRGSKYVQSDMGQTMQAVKLAIQEGKQVLFSGTPCQCAAVDKLIGKNNPNLLTLDFVCHGVPSPAVFDSYVRWLSEKHGTDVDFLAFRAKLPDKIGIYETYRYQQKQKTRAAYDSKYLTGFMGGLIYRHACYTCPYATKERSSDITMCDYWGCEKYHPELDTVKGVSAVIVSTQKGAAWLEKAAASLQLVPTTVGQIASGNANLVHATPKPQERDGFYAAWKRMDFDTVAEKYLTDKQAWKKRLIAKIPKRVKRMLKTLMR